MKEEARVVAVMEQAMSGAVLHINLGLPESMEIVRLEGLADGSMRVYCEMVICANMVAETA